MTLIQMIGRPGPSLPISIRHHSRSTITGGRADPIWDIAHTTKFSRKPKPDAPLVTPKGTMKPLKAFLARASKIVADREAEIQWLMDTQHLELATTRQEMQANGIPSISLNHEDTSEEVIAESDVAAAPYVFDPVLDRRIEWERYLFACGPVHRVFFTATKDGAVGIAYDGPAKKDPDFTMALRRRMKQAWLATHDRLPTLEEVQDANAYLAYYKNTTPLHLGDWIDREEDTDPYRFELHAQEGSRHNDVGYAGPKGTLGLDMEDEPEPGEEPEY